MTIIEKKSERKKIAIMGMVENGEMSIFYALSEAERLNDEGKLLDKDYEELAEWLEARLPVVENNSTLEPEVEEVPENVEEETQEENSEASEENE